MNMEKLIPSLCGIALFFAHSAYAEDITVFSSDPTEKKIEIRNCGNQPSDFFLNDTKRLICGTDCMKYSMKEVIKLGEKTPKGTYFWSFNQDGLQELLAKESNYLKEREDFHSCLAKIKEEINNRKKRVHNKEASLRDIYDIREEQRLTEEIQYIDQTKREILEKGYPPLDTNALCYKVSEKYPPLLQSKSNMPEFRKALGEIEKDCMEFVRLQSLKKPTGVDDEGVLYPKIAQTIEEDREYREDRKEKQLRNPNLLHPVWSALICVFQDFRKAGYQEIASQKKYSRIGGVQNRNVIYQLQMSIRRSDTWIQKSRNELRKIKKTEIPCSRKEISLLAACYKSKELPNFNEPDECHLEPLNTLSDFMSDLTEFK